MLRPRILRIGLSARYHEFSNSLPARDDLGHLNGLFFTVARSSPPPSGFGRAVHHTTISYHVRARISKLPGQAVEVLRHGPRSNTITSQNRSCVYLRRWTPWPNYAPAYQILAHSLQLSKHPKDIATIHTTRVLGYWSFWDR